MYLSLDRVVLKNVSGRPAGICWFTCLAFNSPDTVGLDQVFPMVAVRGRQEQRWTSPLQSPQALRSQDCQSQAERCLELSLTIMPALVADSRL
jgi:hypothetical protein